MPERPIYVTGDFGPEMYVYVEDLSDEPADLHEAWLTAKDFQEVTACGGAGQMASSMGASAVLISPSTDRRDNPAESIYVLTDQADEKTRKADQKRWKVGRAIVAGEKKRDCGELDLSRFPAGEPLAIVDLHQGFVHCCYEQLHDLVQGRHFAVRTHDPIYAEHASNPPLDLRWAELRPEASPPSLWFCPRQDMADGSLRVPGAWQSQQDNLIRYLQTDESLWKDGEWRHCVVVQIDNDGCLVLGPGAETTLLVFPGEQPGSHKRKTKGEVVVGGGIVILAALAEALRDEHLEHQRVVEQASVGLVKARKFLELGYRRPAAEGKPDSYTVTAFSPNHPRTGKSLFPLEEMEKAAQDLTDYPQRYARPPHETVDDAIRLLEMNDDEFSRQIVFSLEKWSTCDPEFAEELLLARDRIETHVKSNENKVLNFAVFGGPGSGKSFMVDQIQASVGDERLSTMKYNVSQFQSLQHLQDALVAVQSEALRGNVPFVQWDEFDCIWDRQEGGWMSRFLMPMQDAAFAEGTIKRALGKCVFIFIGGTFAGRDKFRTWTKEAKGIALKGPDFHSRLDRVLEVPSIDTDSCGTPYLNRALTIRRDLREAKIQAIERPVAKLLLEAPFTHGMRSLKTIIASSSLRSTDRFCGRHLPPMNVLKEHLKEVDESIKDSCYVEGAGEAIKLGQK